MLLMGHLIKKGQISNAKDIYNIPHMNDNSMIHTYQKYKSTKKYSRHAYKRNGWASTNISGYHQSGLLPVVSREEITFS